MSASRSMGRVACAVLCVGALAGCATSDAATETTAVANGPRYRLETVHHNAPDAPMLVFLDTVAARDPQSAVQRITLKTYGDVSPQDAEEILNVVFAEQPDDAWGEPGSISSEKEGTWSIMTTVTMESDGCGWGKILVVERRGGTLVVGGVTSWNS